MQTKHPSIQRKPLTLATQTIQSTQPCIHKLTKIKHISGHLPVCIYIKIMAFTHPFSHSVSPVLLTLHGSSVACHACLHTAHSSTWKHNTLYDTCSCTVLLIMPSHTQLWLWYRPNVDCHYCDTLGIKEKYRFIPCYNFAPHLWWIGLHFILFSSYW